MTYQTQARRAKKHQSPIDKHQNKFDKGYVSTFANSRRPEDSVSDATNMELVQDNIWRPRSPLVRYGTQPVGTVNGRGKYRYNGTRGLLWMIAGKIYRQVDGGAFTLIAGANSYDSAAWAGFVQSKSRVYVYNSTNNLSYVDLATMATVEYVALATPAAPSGTGSANLISGTKPYNYYYKVTANNSVGESAASAASTAVNVNDVRDNWSSDIAIAKTVTVTWTAVSGATSYTLYGSDNGTDFYEIITLSSLTTLSYTDNGSQTLNPYKTAPASNSTQGAVFTWMYVDTRNAQVFGVTSTNQLFYSATASSPGQAADFSSLNGGGYTTIDEGGDTQLNFVDGFRTGKGDPVITTSSRGAAGKGKINHVTFDSATFGDQTIFFPDVTEANGQSGTYAPRATVKARDSLYYPTGDAIKSTGTSQNIVNILTTSGLSDLIVPDINNITLGSLNMAAGVEYQDKIYFCLPVGSQVNNEIWILDLARKDAWTLRWTISAKDIWLYEDNNGASHLCVLVNNVIMEFTRAGSRPHTDDGIAWSSRVAFSSLVWDPDGISLGNIHNQYFKLIQPAGNIVANTYGLSKRGATTNTGTAAYTVEVSFTGIGQWDYSGNYQYGDDIGNVSSFAQSVAVLHVRPKGLLNQEDWEVVASTAGTDYILSAVSTRGTANLDLVYQGLTS
jgi:hypothetical protein